MKKVPEMLARHLPSRLNYLKHRITNAASEGINSQVARIIAKSPAASPALKTCAPVSSSFWVNLTSLPLDLNHSRLCGEPLILSKLISAANYSRTTSSISIKMQTGCLDDR